MNAVSDAKTDTNAKNDPGETSGDQQTGESTVCLYLCHIITVYLCSTIVLLLLLLQEVTVTNFVMYTHSLALSDLTVDSV